MVRNILVKLREATQSVLPVSAIVLALHATIAPMPIWTLILFLTGAILLIAGMSVFTLGADIAMVPIGESFGSALTKTRKLWLFVAGGFVLGMVLTVAEPDLQVLARQVPAVPSVVLIAAVGLGVGLFLIFGLLRILFQFPLHVLFVASYALVFAVASFTAPDYLAVGFDSGGVTTGPITVPFILALGAGISAAIGGRNTDENSFGLCALSSIGPILVVLVMGMFFDPSVSAHAFEPPAGIEGVGEFFAILGNGFLQFSREVLTVLLPIVVIFTLFQLVHLRLSRTALIRILIGIVYTLIGLAAILTGVNLGFMPAGIYIGNHIAAMPYRWVLLPLGAIVGFFIVYAEPAVHVLNTQVENITIGAISRRMMMAALSIGASAALVLSIFRVLSGIEIWYFLVPGYAVALALTFFTPALFTAIAFDAGGVASGTMTVAFLLPFAVGICEAVGGNVITDAFGIVAMVAMMPLITVQLMGLIHQSIRSRTREGSGETD
ncbi:MAG: DUF1538 domain-containing protein [Methanomicrobiales archaeon]|nr:DUF1538 domain-containing protein [Methanomicrobiales archaeon]MDI6876591.1 DUF1538 domain-containing protein [Methanomicrobiales archaeon]